MSCTPICSPASGRRLHATVAEALLSGASAAAKRHQPLSRRTTGGSGQRWPEAIRAAMRAGDAAARINGYPEAAEQYERVLEMWFRPRSRGPGRLQSRRGDDPCGRGEPDGPVTPTMPWLWSAQPIDPRTSRRDRDSGSVAGTGRALPVGDGRHSDRPALLDRLASRGSEADSPNSSRPCLRHAPLDSSSWGDSSDSAAACEAALEAAGGQKRRRWRRMYSRPLAWRGHDRPALGRPRGAA